MDKTLVAFTPSDIAVQQRSLSAWCVEKMRELGADYRDMKLNLVVAKRSKWRHTGIERQVVKLRKRIQFYAKMRAAVDAGYLIIPNFDVEVMAVRVTRLTPAPNKLVDSGTYANTPRQPEARPALAPVGTGRYVDQAVFVHTEKWEQPDGDKVKKFASSECIGFDEPDFPVLAIKPSIMMATERAMARRIFDRIGVVTGRREDPIVLGQIVDPREPGHKWGRARVVSFFIAWWVDTKDL